MEERLFNTLSMLNEEMAGVSIATKKAVAKKIAAFIRSEYVEKEFVKWLTKFDNKHMERCGTGWRIPSINRDKQSKEYSLDKTYQYWLKEVKGVKK